MGSTCERIEKIIIIAKSSEEFGYLEKVTVFIGIIGDKEESVLYENKFTKESYEFNIEQAAIDLTGSGYIRAKIITNLGKIALSNPIWF
jgi:translation initiation factor 2B subunit (eIF-2B alpha/beta/delta family)